MKKKTTQNFKKLFNNFFPIVLLGIGLTMSAQNAQELPAPISELRLNEKGEISCSIHSNDAAALDHHSLGTSESNLNPKAVNKISLKSKKGASGAQINVSYFNFDPNVSSEELLLAINAFQSAIDIWASLISSDVPINVAAVFQPLATNVLGSAGPTFIFRDVPGLEANTWYGNALAEKLVGEELTPGSFDIIARFSTVFPNWYYGTDSNTPAGDYDFRSVVLHELGHGLGFFGSMRVNNNTGIGSYGFGIDPVYPAIYDRLANSADGKSILKEDRYGNNSLELGSVLLSGPLTAKGPNTKRETVGKGAKLFTILDSEIFGDIPGLTDTWLPGSSYSHLDFFTYRGSNDGLMVPFLSRGVAFDNPGPIVLSMFDDMGWNGKVNNEVAAISTDISDGDDSSAESALILYPNPFVDSIQVDMGTEQRSIIKATVLDIYGDGMEIPSTTIEGSSVFTIDMSSLTSNSDLFFLKITFDTGETETFKLYRSN